MVLRSESHDSRNGQAALLPPSRLSLPRAAETPVNQLDFSYAARKRSAKCGIASALQLAEIAVRNPKVLRHLAGVTPTEAIRLLEARFGPLPDFTQVAVSDMAIPPAGASRGADEDGGEIEGKTPDSVGGLDAVKERLDALQRFPNFCQRHSADACRTQ